MELDNLERIQQLDTLNMLAEIESLPDQLARAYQMGYQTSEVSKTSEVSLRHVVITGLGGSAIGADLLAAFVVGAVAGIFPTWRGATIRIADGLRRIA